MDELRRLLVEAAIRAPSGDNCQPWHFRLEDQNKILIHIVPERARSFFDLGFRATFLSVGAVIENMRVAAAYKGYGLHVEYGEGVGKDNPAAVVTLKKTGNSLDFLTNLHDALQKRTVNRRPFLPVKLSSQLWDRLLGASTIEEVKVVTYTSREHLRAWKRAVKAADMIRWTHPTIHRELFEKVRYSASEAEAERTGLEIDRLGIGPSAPIVMRTLSSWDRMKRLRRFGVAKMLAGQSALLLGLSSGLVGVWASEDSPRGWTLAGEQTERLWNVAQDLGLAVQPSPIALYLHRRRMLEGENAFMAEHIRYLDEIADTLKIIGHPQNYPVGTMLFRIGKTWSMKHPAIRIPLEAFVDADSDPPALAQ